MCDTNLWVEGQSIDWLPFSHLASPTESAMASREYSGSNIQDDTAIKYISEVSCGHGLHC